MKSDSSKKQTIRVGIIGCGVISNHHAQAFSENPDAELIACADLSRGATERLAARFAIPATYTNAHALLQRSDLDAVLICIPPKWHAEYFLAAIAEGKHVLVEKPLARDLAEADQMLEAAAASDRIVGVALVHRYLPAYSILREMIRSGAIGAVRQVRFSFGCNMYEDSRFRTPEEDPRAWLVDEGIAGGGILMSSSIHFLSVLSFVLDDRIARCIAATVRQLHPRAFPGIEDDVDLRMQLNHGTEFVFRESWVADHPYRAEFSGECGQLTVTGENWRYLHIEGECRGSVPQDYINCLAGVEFRADSPRQKTRVDSFFGGLVTDFVESVERGAHQETLPTVQHARNMQAVVVAAYQAGKTGRVQDVDWHYESV